MADLSESRAVHEAFRRTCHAFGVEQLAIKMGVSAGVLHNKCNLNESSHHKPTFRDLVLAQAITSDKQITQALAHAMGGVFVDLSALQEQSDEALLDLVSCWMKEQGDLFAAWQECYGDGRISADDSTRLRKESSELLRAILHFVTRVEGMQS